MKRKQPRQRIIHPQLEALEERSLMSVIEASVLGDYTGYAISEMPDIDQRRTTIEPLTLGLPGDGAMYCVPTAAMNLAAYIANHGFPSVGPGPGNWQLGPPDNFGVYNNMSQDLANLGTLMGTDAVTGTGGTAALNGLDAYLQAGAPGDFVVSHYYAHDSYSPTLRDMALSAIDGNLVEPVVGWYSNADTNLPHERKGGHALSLVEAHTGLLFGPAETIGFSDPADDSDKSTQSPFTVSSHGVHEVTGIFDGVQRTFSRVEDFGSAYLDEYFAIRPKFALSADLNFLYLNYPIQLDPGPERAVTRKVRSATGGAVLDLAISPEGTRHPYLIAGSDTVWQLDSITGQSSPLAHVDHPQHLVYGGADQSLYVLTDRQLIRLGRDGRQVGQTPLDSALDAMASDIFARPLVGVSQATKKLYFFDHDLRPTGQVALPDVVATALGGTQGGRVSLAAGPDGSLLLHLDGSTDLFRLTQDVTGGWQAQKVTLQGARSPQGLSVDDQGHLFFSDGNVLVEYQASGQQVERSKFTGLPGGQVVQVLLNFSNFDPQQHTGPAYFNILPENAVRPPPPSQGQPSPTDTSMPHLQTGGHGHIMDITSMLSIQIITPKKHFSVSSVKQKVTLTNHSDQPIHGPVFFLLKGLKKKTRLKNKSGITAMQVQGTSFFSIDLDTLPPGGGRTFTLIFQGVKPHYTPAVFAGFGAL
jgi:hypothetical protein